MKQINLFKSKGGSIGLPLRSVSRFFMVAMMLFATLQISAQEEKEKKMYVVIGNDVATYYYDENYKYRQVSFINSDYSRPLSGNADITTVVFDPSFAAARPTSTYFWFNRMTGLKEIIGLEYLNTSNVTNMLDMFAECSSLTSIDVSNFNTSNVTTMCGMFWGCSSLTNLDVSNFDTSNVTDLTHMFNGCSSLTSLDVSRFNTGSATKMYNMFDGCSSLTSLDVSNFNTSNVENMIGMFYKCSSLTSIDVTGFDTRKVTSMANMFAKCSSLTSIDVSKFNTSNVEDMGGMFWGCSGLTSLDLSNFNTSNVTKMRDMFDGCNSLTNLDISNFKTDKATSMRYMFEDCTGLTNIDLGHFNTSNVTDMQYMFSNCSSLTNLDLSSFDTSNVTDMTGMFSECSGLTSLDMKNFDTSNVTKMAHMFRGCSNLVNLDISNFNTENVTTMYYMFRDCNSLTSIDLSKFNTSNVESLNMMFYNCSSLEYISLGENITQMPSFSDSKKIKRIISYLKEPYAIASNCFADVVKENAKLYVPRSASALYQNADGWKEFMHIVAMELDPEDDETILGISDLNENTDLDGNIVGNVFFNISKEEGEYDTNDKCIVLTNSITDETVNNIVGLDLFDENLLDNFTGLIFMLNAGNGTIELEAETLGNMQLNVKIGDAEPTTQKVDGKSKVSIPYNVTEPTYVYVYGTTQSAAKATRSANATGDALKLYSIAWGDATGISNINMSADKQATIYNLNGQRVTTPGKGLYIVNGKKVILK